MFELYEGNNESIKDFRVTLNNGYKFPLVNFGTFRISGLHNIRNILDIALQAGYRGLDTASVYGNEEDIGEALKYLLPKYNLSREDIFITTKLAPGNLGSEDAVKAAVNKSLTNLNTSYIDLYLIHWPGSGGVRSDHKSNYIARSNAWDALIKLYDKGKGPLKAIGVSNYNVRHMKQLLEDIGFPPAVNQIEFHPHWKESEALETICKQNQILLQAYSPLGGSGNRNLLNEQNVNRIANKHNISPAQVVLRWILQRNFAIVPKSVTESRIIENINLNKNLDEDDMKNINEIKFSRKYAWDPDCIY